MNQLDCMRTFASVVETGSFAKASKSLGISRALVTQRVKGLEEHLNTQLLLRTTRNVEPTNAGLEYFESCKTILRAVDLADLQAGALQTRSSGTLRVSSPASFAVKYLCSDLCDFQRDHSELSIELVHTEDAVNPINENFDLSIQVHTLDIDSVYPEPLAPAQRLVVGSPAYLTSNPPPQTPLDLKKHRTIHTLQHDGNHQWVFYDNESKKSSIELIPKVSSNNIWYLRENAIRGNGLAVLPTFFVCDDLLTGRLVSVLENYVPEELWLTAWLPKSEYTPASARLLLNHLKSQYSGVPPWQELLKKVE